MKKLVLALTFMLFCMIGFIGVVSVNAAAIYDHEVTFDMNGGDYTHDDIKSLGSKLNSAAEPAVIFVEGDSTSAGTTGWLYRSMEMFGPSISDYSIQYRLWDNATKSYNTNVNLQYGDKGDAYALMIDDVDNYMSTMDSTALSIVGDIEIRAKIRVDKSQSGSIVAKWASGGNNSYFLNYSTDITGTVGAMQFYWTADGTTIESTSSGNFTVVDGADIWLRVTFDVDNGGGGYTANYYRSIDGVTWTFIDDTVTAAGTTSINDSTAPVELGSRSVGLLNTFDGRIYQVEIRDGIGGKIVASPNLDLAFPSSVNSFKDAEGNTWMIHGDVSVGNGAPGLLILNGSISGAAISTFNATVIDDMLDLQPDLFFINLSHNEDVNDSYTTMLESFITNTLVYAPEADVVLVTQNPQTAPRTAAQITAQDVRNDQIRLVAARNNYVLIDAGSILASDPSAYISADGVHPTVAGYDVWADKVSDTLAYGLNGGGFGELTLLFEDGELAVAPDDPTKAGATFLGWYTNATLTDKFDFATDKVQDDMVLFAKWSNSTSGVAIIGGSLSNVGSFLGLSWYWWIGIAAGAYLVFGTKKGRKAIGMKK